MVKYLTVRLDSMRGALPREMAGSGRSRPVPDRDTPYDGAEYRSRGTGIFDGSPGDPGRLAVASWLAAPWLSTLGGAPRR